ncbi:phosphatidylethanolamine N-methyltransferase [Tilletia horrida]|nr:phosphatidylethanolamine N-methyltransferase [Tilletia horrida]
MSAAMVAHAQPPPDLPVSAAASSPSPSASASAEVRQRKQQQQQQQQQQQLSQEPSLTTAEQQPLMGRLKDGREFEVPSTPDMLTSIFDPRQPKTPLDILTLVSLAAQITIYFFTSRAQAQAFFLVYFLFWRAAYNAGLGWVLNAQSKKNWIVSVVDRHGWLDEKRAPKTRAWIKQQLETKMRSDYDFEALPNEYNIWLLFRSIVDVILLNDFVAYSLFAFSCTRLPEGHSVWAHIGRWALGWTLIAFNAWVKLDAHRVVKDYAWYWGDCFFLCLQQLVFDGVYNLAPDPMYSIGYAGYYGLSLCSASYAVFFVSLAAHFSQFLFLQLFESPHIARTYGEGSSVAAWARKVAERIRKKLC